MLNYQIRKVGAQTKYTKQMDSNLQLLLLSPPAALAIPRTYHMATAV
jgi:hypothetical protein